ncbi:MAG: PIN domain protein, partial [Candidatus Omnitrophota bacterium]
MKIYLDNCCFNRPFDDQSHIRIRLESEAKLKIQEEIRAGNLNLGWSYILDYVNSKNPFHERKNQIGEWKKYAISNIHETKEVIDRAISINQMGLQKIDSLHLACAILTKCEY